MLIYQKEYERTIDTIDQNQHPSEQNLLLENRPGYLYAAIHGDALDRVSWLDHLSEIASETADLRVKRVLIEHIGTLATPAEDLAPIFTEYIRLGFGIRIAFVASPFPGDQNIHHLESLAHHGGADFKHFPTVPEAESWVLAA